MNRRIYRDPRTASRLIAGEAIVLTPRDGRIMTLNETASCIWDLLADGPSLADVVSRLMTEFNVDRNKAMLDARSFLDELVAREMVTLDEPCKDDNG